MFINYKGNESFLFEDNEDLVEIFKNNKINDDFNLGPRVSSILLYPLYNNAVDVDFSVLTNIQEDSIKLIDALKAA